MGLRDWAEAGEDLRGEAFEAEDIDFAREACTEFLDYFSFDGDGIAFGNHENNAFAFCNAFFSIFKTGSCFSTSCQTVYQP